MTKGELLEKLKDVPDDKEILVCGKCANGRECGNVFGISEDDDAVYIADAVYLKTDIVVDFDYLCTEKTAKQARIDELKGVLDGIRILRGTESSITKLIEAMEAESQ